MVWLRFKDELPPLFARLCFGPQEVYDEEQTKTKRKSLHSDLALLTKPNVLRAKAGKITGIIH